MSRVTLHNADCLDVLRALPAASVDLVLTDPPYLLDVNTRSATFPEKHRHMADIRHLCDGFPEAVLDECCRVLRRVNICLFCSLAQIPVLLGYFVARRRCNWNLLCWHKNNVTPLCGNTYVPDSEYVLFFREKGVRIHGTPETKRTWYVTYNSRRECKAYGHPTVKPLAIVSNLVVNHSLPGQTVLDPFMGSGTSGVAAKSLGRDFIGVEIDPRHFQTARRRIGEANALFDTPTLTQGELL